jgi:threonine dehydrogenase-like Zn-dependent dehydrogenase
MNRLRVLAGERVLLFGAGAMGQQLIQTLVKMGASELVVVDISEPKLQLAAQWGASRCILSSEIDAVYERNEYPYGFDVVVDATGLPQVIQQCFRFLGPAGKYLQFGVTAQNDSIQLSPFELYHKDWTLLGTMAINHTFIPAFDWVREGRVKLDHLISAVIPLEEAINYLQGPRDPNWMKVQIKL